MNRWADRIIIGVIAVMAALPVLAASEQTGRLTENFSGYYSRVGNNESPSKTTNNNIYIKFFKDRWIATLYVPYPYAASVAAPVISRVLDRARGQTSTSSYLRGLFSELEQEATVHIERYGYLEDRIVFECGSLAPCTIKLGDNYLELIKPGVINEHIIRYDHVKGE